MTVCAGGLMPGGSMKAPNALLLWSNLMQKVPLDDQIAGIERAVVNLRGSIEILRGLIAKKQRDPIELKMKESWLPELEASLATLKWLKDNEFRIKNALRQK
jgi:hypothetical protein